MNMFLISLITGLTTGGLSCLAVQGGLLASSVANQWEAESPQHTSAKNKKMRSHTSPIEAVSRTSAQPILLFLFAKLVIYSLLGLALGAFGSMFSLSVPVRVAMQILIGIFMIGNAMRMLNVHPVFRFFSFEPPLFVRRAIRRLSKHGERNLTPLFLGALTVLIPCGVTQAMMALAITTADPIQGFTILFGFTLGTIPVFFGLAYLTTQLEARLEKTFMRVVALTILVLGIIALDSGLALSGSPLSFNNLSRSLRAATTTDQTVSAALLETRSDGEGQAEIGIPEEEQTKKRLYVNANNNGYAPDILRFSADTPFELVLVTDNTRSCTRAFVIPALGIEALLPQDGQIVFDVPAQPAGSRLYFSCSMGMYGGMIVFDG